MAAYFCPNFSNPEVKKDFNSLVNEFGENRAYLYWHRHKGDMSQIKEKASKIDKTPVSKIDKTYIERLDEANEKYGDLIGKDNNPFVWDIQDEFNLLEKEKFLPPLEGEKFKRRNFRKIGDEAAAERLAKRIEDKYGPDVTARAFSRKIYNSKTKRYSTKYIVKAFTSPTKENFKYLTEKYQPKLYQDWVQSNNKDLTLVRDTSISGMEERDVDNNQLDKVSDIVNFIKSTTNAKEVLEYVRNNHDVKDPRDKQLLEFLIEHASKNEWLTINIEDIKDTPSDLLNAYAYFNPETHNITFIEQHTQDSENSSYDKFIRSILHEYIHGYTAKALTSPESQLEEEFGKEIKKIYNMYKRAATDEQLAYNGFKNSKEFLSEMMSNKEFNNVISSISVNQPAAKKYKYFDRLIKAIQRLFGITTKQAEPVNEVFERTLTFISKADQFVDFTSNTISSAMPVQESIYDLRGKLDLNDRDSFKRLLRDFAKGFTHGDLGTVHKKSNFTILPTTKIMKQFGYGIDPDELEGNVELQDAIDRSTSIGSVVHGNFESIIEQKGLEISEKSNVLKLSSTPELRKAQKEIIDRFKGRDVTIMSEVFVADLRKAIGGIIDMVVVDENNKIHIYDFKTKEKGFDQYDVRYTNSIDNTLKPSARQNAHTQLSLYKMMFENMTGLTVSDVNVVLVQPEVKGKKVINAKLADKYDEGIDTRTEISEKADIIYSNISNVNINEESMLSGIPSSTGEHMSMATEERLKTLAYQNTQVDKVESTLNTLLKALNHKLKIAKKANNKSKVREIESNIENVRREEDSMKSLVSILDYALTETADISEMHARMRRKGEDITIGRLHYWKEFVLAYEGFGEYAQWLAENIPTMQKENKKFSKDLLKRIHLLQERVQYVKNLYETEGIEKLAEFLSPYYNEVRAKVRNNLIVEYKKQSPSFKKTTTVDQYVEKGLKENEYNINERTKILLKEEMRKASRDISDLGLWLDNLLDSKDPVVASMVKSFAHIDWTSHNQALEKRTEFINILKELEKVEGFGLLKDPKKIYEFMLEKDEKGEFTGHFVSRFRSALHKEYLEIVKETRNLPEEQRDRARKEWKDKRTIFHRQQFQAAKNKYIVEELLEPGIITQEHLEEIQNLDQRYKRGDTDLTLKDLANIGDLPIEAANAIEDWIYKNAWNFREIRKEYKNQYENPQYDELLKLKDQKDPRWDFYQFVMNTMTEANGVLPYTTRIGNRLPGVVKSSRERVKSGDNILSTFKETIKDNFDIRPDDIERDNKEMIGQDGKAKYFLPIHYTGEVELSQQSFDIPTIVFKYWQSANDFSNKLDILPEMELAKYFIENRNTDAVANRKLHILTGWNKKPKNKEELRANNNNLAKQVNEWFLTNVYGRPKKDQGSVNLLGLNIDVAKFVDNLNSYTSLNLLGLNFIQGTANTTLGEVLQTAEGVAKEYMSLKSYRKGTEFYMKNFANVLGDVGRRDPKSLVCKLMEHYDILDEWEGAEFGRTEKYRNIMHRDTLYFTTHVGEHEMQGRFLFSMLHNKRAYDKNGKDLGPMLYMYEVNEKTGKLQLNEKVDVKKSKWTEKDQFEFGYKVRGILSRLHGEYSDLGRVAMQRGAIGRMAFMFRKFVVPGFKRRWAKESYIERLDDFVEGSYISTGRFFGRLFKDLIHLKFEVGTHWDEMTDHQKSNIRRTLTELSFLITAMIVAGIAIQKMEDDDDDERMWAFFSYQAVRLRAELLFFIWPPETWSILRSPAASMSMIEHIAKTLAQLTNPTEIYERGPWKGKPKIYKHLTRLAPGYRQYYRIRDLREQLSWFSAKVN